MMAVPHEQAISGVKFHFTTVHFVKIKKPRDLISIVVPREDAARRYDVDTKSDPDYQKSAIRQMLTRIKATPHFSP
jgi:hypothetical protein